MTVPTVYAYMAGVHGTAPPGPDPGLMAARWYGWFGVPIGVTAVSTGAGLVIYMLLFGDGLTTVTPTVPSSGWTSVATGSVGSSTFFLFKRVTGPSDPDIYEFTYTPTDKQLVLLGVAVADVAAETVGTPQFASGNTAASDALSVPAGNVLSVHMWGGKQSPAGGDTWIPDATFPVGHNMQHSLSSILYAGTIGEVGGVASAPGESAVITANGQDNFGIQFLFSDIPVAVGGWGVGHVRMGAN